MQVCRTYVAPEGLAPGSNQYDISCWPLNMTIGYNAAPVAEIHSMIITISQLLEPMQWTVFWSWPTSALCDNMPHFYHNPPIVSDAPCTLLTSPTTGNNSWYLRDHGNDSQFTADLCCVPPTHAAPSADFISGACNCLQRQPAWPHILYYLTGMITIATD